jgi:hypothetical protein
MAQKHSDISHCLNVTDKAFRRHKVLNIPDKATTTRAYRGSITGQNEQKIIDSKLVLIQLPMQKKQPAKGHSEDVHLLVKF